MFAASDNEFVESAAVWTSLKSILLKAHARMLKKKIYH